MIRIATIACVACLVTGCMLPVPATTSRTLDRTVSAPVPGPTGRLELATKVVDSTVMVTASWPRECRRNIHDVVEDTTALHRQMLGGPDAEWIGWVVGAVAWPVGLGSIILTEGEVVFDHPTIRVREEWAGELKTACPLLAANVPIVLTLPSGRVIDGTTDGTGSFMLLLPPNERSGAVQVRAARDVAPVTPAVAAPPAQTADEQEQPADDAPGPPGLTPPAPRTGFAAVHDLAMTCGARLGVAGIVRLRVAIDRDGNVTSIEPDTASRSLGACLNHDPGLIHFGPETRGTTIVVPFSLDARRR